MSNGRLLSVGTRDDESQGESVGESLLVEAEDVAEQKRVGETEQKDVAYDVRGCERCEAWKAKEPELAGAEETRCRSELEGRCRNYREDNTVRTRADGEVRSREVEDGVLAPMPIVEH